MFVGVLVELMLYVAILIGLVTKTEGKGKYKVEENEFQDILEDS